MTRFRSRGRWSLAVAVGLLALGAPVARAEDCCDDAHPVRQWCIRRFRGDLYYGRNNRPHTFERAGNPQHLSRFAMPSETPNWGSYYVGGGCTCKGAPPGPADGTYGWDYMCFWKYRYQVVLKWCHRYKGGYGAYATDGPPVYDIGPTISEAREGPARKFKPPEALEHGEHGEHGEHSEHGEGH
jgi:hypothetical protein